ncbi:NADPH-dependent assimilatory sulfite reductase hemoprotein subunit [Kushneria phosphatilytica]|uniref:Sulfite reductase [NADPH] hemoprotein beta-component n=1 Tax=Kushneria phosphatilytica TaxID=657387 RepID=A0A1S1NYU0_9GAMM|nr:NADPH-dependent assimilatory sulfite reductase hemoprotein subunit [Kushneria phosphatilytica]OHV12902.1 sulfite reductase subunit beta [Kushneria phosphatilytica]QEL10765.1 NADPH-dependent assimilatory sulfite reductase hemoprotein subunit [Kushneria phosphatilytica]
MTDIITKLRDISFDELHPNERLKFDSSYLRGGLMAGMNDRATGAVSEADTQLTKFHGFYQQDDRDVRNERRQRKLEPLYSFMVRLRLPGGRISAAQWQTLDDVATQYANDTLRITTRQTFQYHGVFKENLRAHLKTVNDAMIDTIAACGDVNRNVTSTANPHLSAVHHQVYELAGEISAHLLPRTRAYHEIFLGEELVAGGLQEAEEQEPLYTRHYLPRKFKIGLAIPPDNELDVFTNDIAFVADVDAQGQLKGFNVAVGGGMGTTHGEPATYPRMATVIGYCTVEQTVDVAEKIMLVQRDNGNRHDRKNARLKYTVDAMGVDHFKAEVESYLGYELDAERPFEFNSTGDRLGWHQGEDDQWHYGLFIENGRIRDYPVDNPIHAGMNIKSGLRAIADIHDGDIVLTTNQNVIITCVAESNREKIDAIIDRYHMERSVSPLRQHSIACVAFPTCGLAMAESERYLPTLLDKLDGVMKDAGLENDPIVIRMTGCPNGCGRPFMAEIGFVGKAIGRYNLYLGGNDTGTRLNKMYRENIDEKTILEELTPLLHRYAGERKSGECFGDFVIRAGVIKATTQGLDFHDT